MVQLVSRPIFQGESKSEEGNLKFSLWVLIQPYPGWVWGEGWVTFPNLDGSICTWTHFWRRVRISRWDLHNWPVACDTAKVIQGVEERVRCTSTILQYFTLPYIVSLCPPPLIWPCLIHPIPCPCLPPYPIFAFLDDLWTLLHVFLLNSIYACTCNITSSESMPFNCFFGCNQLPGRGKCIPFAVGTRCPQSVQIFICTLWCIPMHPSQQMYSREALW